MVTLQRNRLATVAGSTGRSEVRSTHPGVRLREDFLEPLGLTAGGLARALDVPKNRVTGILNGRRGVSANSALRLARFFGTTAEFWMNLQVHHDLEVERRADGGEILRTVVPRQAAPAT